MCRQLRRQKGQSEGPSLRLATIRPDYLPPETYAGHVSKKTREILEDSSTTTHIAVVDKDILIDDSFYNLPHKWPEADIIAANVIPTSLVRNIWEKLTYWARLGPRIRGGAVIYSCDFLRRVGGYPAEGPADTILLSLSKNTIVSEIRALHTEPVSIGHSVRVQIRDGKNRAMIRYPVWRTILHAVFRIRPFVLASYTYHRLRRTA